MSIERNITKSGRRSEERNVSRKVPVYLTSAPPNGARGLLASIYKPATLTG